jgi:glycosyltransferase involved in cell wall biosynthesis
MKIAWFHGNMRPTHSGGTRFVLDYAIGLKQMFNHTVTVYCDQASEEVKSRLTDAGVPLIETDSTSTNNPFYWLTLPMRNILKKKRLGYITKEYDCIINSLFPMNVLVAKFKIPKIQMCYEPYAFFYDSSFLLNFTLPQRVFFHCMKFLYEKSDKRSVAQMDRLLTVNKTNLPKIEAVYDRTAIPIYAGLDTHLYKRASSEEIETIRQRHPGSPLLFHSTDLTGIKGTYPLLEIIKLLTKHHPAIKLLVTVYLDLPDGVTRFKKRIKAMGLESHIQYLGCLPKEELPAYFSAVDFVCQPSRNQPANWLLKEAMLCGTPIIGGAESEEADGRNGIKINVEATKESTDELNKLFARDRDSFVIDQEELKQQFSIDNCLKQFNEVIESLCK